MKILLSIVIPTHNRAQYAVHSIKSILDLNCEHIELVVSDTSSDCVLEEWISKLNISETKVRLSYIKHKTRLDMTENHNFSLSQATGEYVCLIGDDDSISPELCELAEWAKNENVKLITPKVKASYNWPDFVTKVYGKQHAKRLYLPTSVGDLIKKNSQEALVSALDRACQGTDGLPKLYHGLVSRALLEELRNRTGAYVHGSSPDMSAAIGLALITKEFYEIDYPLTIPGASGGSNTGRSALNKHKGKMSSESQTSAFIDSGWNPFIPKFFSVETVWSHAAVKTLEKLAPNYVCAFNWLSLYSLCEIKHSDFFEEIRSSKECYSNECIARQARMNFIIFTLKMKYYYHRVLYISSRMLKPTAAGGKKYIPGVENVADTPKLLLAYVKSNGFSLSSLLARHKRVS